MRLKVACAVSFEVKNINGNINVKIRSYLCNGFFMFFLIEDYEGKSNFVPFFRACQLHITGTTSRSIVFFRKNKHISDIFRFSRP